MKEIKQLPIFPANEPFRWGDELEIPEMKPQLENDSESHSFTSIAKLLEDQIMIERKRLEEYLKKKVSDPK